MKINIELLTVDCDAPGAQEYKTHQIEVDCKFLDDYRVKNHVAGLISRALKDKAKRNLHGDRCGHSYTYHYEGLDFSQVASQVCSEKIDSIRKKEEEVRLADIEAEKMRSTEITAAGNEPGANKHVVELAAAKAELAAAKAKVKELEKKVLDATPKQLGDQYNDAPCFGNQKTPEPKAVRRCVVM